MTSMPILGTLRRVLLTPKLTEVSFAVRGFPGADSPAAEALEAIPQAVISGFEWGIEAKTLWEVERKLALVRQEQRGFAYEGAAMAATVRDAMAGGRGKKAKELLGGPGAPHIFLTYIGIGFAMARLPRVLWKKVIPDISESPYHPTMTWLAVDGFGFDRAYFQTKRWVDEQRVPKPYPWEGSPEYFLRAYDQGVGRALWFINGARPEAVAKAVNGFAEHRRADLWSGVGLAATFAGGGDEAGLTWLRQASGAHWSELALGAVFAVKARTYAGFTPPHSELAARAMAGLTIDEAVEIADSTAADPWGSGIDPAYERWRERIRTRLVQSVVSQPSAERVHP
ncbi:UnbL [Alloactinosynnema sp. L-07]|nr:UnbL [Alloactinosynnema sp. L-07]